MTYLIPIGAALFFAVLWWDVETDYRKWNRKPVKHTKEAWIRAALLIPSGVCLFLGHEAGMCFWVFLNVAAMMFSLYWLLFDGLYNKRRGFAWSFPGSVDTDDATLDKLVVLIGVRLSQFIKIILSAVSVAIYIISIWA